MLAARSTEPPTGVSVLVRSQEMQRFDLLGDLWAPWQLWFAELEETHTSLGVLSFFRSPRAHRSWITSCGAVLDAASLRLAAVDLPFDPQAGLCVRSGRFAWNAVAEYFHLAYSSDPAPTDPISISRASSTKPAPLARAGIPIRRSRPGLARLRRLARELTSRCSVWRVCSWRPTPWSSDRSLPPRTDAQKIQSSRRRGSRGCADADEPLGAEHRRTRVGQAGKKDESGICWRAAIAARLRSAGP